MKRVLMTTWLLLASCGAMPTPLDAGDPEYLIPPITVSCDGCESNVLSDAMKFWNDGIGLNLFAAAEDGSVGNADIVVVDYQPNGNDAFAWWYADGTCDVEIWKERASVARLLSHELGHCLGFNHSSDPLSIMHDEIDEDAEITNEIRETVIGLIEAGEVVQRG